MESSGNSATGSPYITQANPQPISKPGNATYVFRTQWHLFLPPVYKGRAGQLHYEMPCSGIALDVAYTAKTQVRSWSSYTCISSENRKRWRRKILRAQENAPHIRPSLFWKYEFRRDCLCVGLSLSPSGSVSLPPLSLSLTLCMSVWLLSVLQSLDKEQAKRLLLLQPRNRARSVYMNAVMHYRRVPFAIACT